MMEGRIVDGRYVILEKVGAGGMADVYRARDNETGEEVAVKQMPRGSFERSGICAPL